MPDFVEQFMKNPTSSLAIMRCYPWHYQDHVLLMGDAAHAIVPFYGQGMNAGFEDCTIFDEMLDQYANNYESLFADFGKRRKPDGDAIADLALRNFIEMRDLTADPEFSTSKKKLRHVFQINIPNCGLRYTPWLPFRTCRIHRR